MGMALALGYLAVDHIRPAPAEGDQLRLGKALIAPLDDSRGPYTRLDSAGYQMLLDYHGGPHRFPFKSIGEIMRSDEAASLVRGRAVLIGVTSESVKDSFSTPFGTGFGSEEPIWGITVHAHIADQLIRGAIDGAPSLRGLSRGGEDLWIWGWAIAGMALGLLVRYPIPAACGSAIGVMVLAGAVYHAFGMALLLPAAPAAIAWLGSAGLTNRIMYAASNRARAVAQELRTLFAACRDRPDAGVRHLAEARRRAPGNFGGVHRRRRVHDILRDRRAGISRDRVQRLFRGGMRGDLR
jgi:CHASE2 domain-containing sensor protein